MLLSSSIAVGCAIYKGNRLCYSCGSNFMKCGVQ